MCRCGWCLNVDGVGIGLRFGEELGAGIILLVGAIVGDSVACPVGPYPTWSEEVEVTAFRSRLGAPAVGVSITTAKTIARVLIGFIMFCLFFTPYFKYSTTKRTSAFLKLCQRYTRFSGGKLL